MKKTSDYTALFSYLKDYRQIIVDCQLNSITSFLNKALEMQMLTSDYHYHFMSLVCNYVVCSSFDIWHVTITSCHWYVAMYCAHRMTFDIWLSLYVTGMLLCSVFIIWHVTCDYHFMSLVCNYVACSSFDIWHLTITLLLICYYILGQLTIFYLIQMVS